MDEENKGAETLKKLADILDKHIADSMKLQEEIKQKIKEQEE